MHVDNGIIMAAGMSSRFAPLSYETHKGLIEVKGEILIERQIKQLIDAGVPKVIVVTGYMADRFDYLKGKYGVELIFNEEFNTRNNNGSIWTAKEYLGNSYVCSADNFFSENPFENDVDDAYYAAVYADGETKEWCMTEDEKGYIIDVKVGGRDAWYMLGHTFWDEDFSNSFLEILVEEYENPETLDKLWESIFMEHLDSLKMKIKKYPDGVIHEFDTLDELRQFDESYITDTRSSIIKGLMKELGGKEEEIKEITAIKGQGNKASGFSFLYRNNRFEYDYNTAKLIESAK
ncbi:MAG: NTP transferase domain-containing protein [Firmicutes bacterium]|nr:NTP transferase domain-containing protein [Bacillota bacterium]